MDTGRRAIAGQPAHPGPYNNCATLRPLLDAASQALPIGCVVADAEIDSERYHQHIRQQLKANSTIPAKRGNADWHTQGVRFYRV